MSYYTFKVTDGDGSYYWTVTAPSLDEAKAIALADCGTHASLELTNVVATGD